MDITKFVAHSTPIETYMISNDPKLPVVYVKRDDLCVNDPELPNLCKVRGLVPILLDYQRRGIRKVAVYATRVSRIGWAAAVLCKYLGLKCTYYYPVFVGAENLPLPAVSRAKLAGAKVVSLQVKDNTISHINEAADIADERGEKMLPYGLASRLAVNAYRAEALTIPDEYKGGTVVGCLGSGTTLLGIWMGLPQATVIGVQVGSEASWNISPAKGQTPIRVVTSPHSYYNVSSAKAPFPCDRHYDCKAWEWLEQNIQQLKPPVLFYNMG